MVEENNNNIQSGTPQSEPVVFRSKDIRATQSKNSPKYFVNIKQPRRKKNRLTSRMILVISIVAFVLIAGIGVSIYIMYNQPHQQPEDSEIIPESEDFLTKINEIDALSDDGYYVEAINLAMQIDEDALSDPEKAHLYNSLSFAYSYIGDTQNADHYQKLYKKYHKGGGIE